MKYSLLLLPLVLCFSSCIKAENNSADTPVEVRTGAEGSSPEYLHPRFLLGRGDLGEMTGGMPEDIREKILKDPRDFLNRIERVFSLPEEQVLLVDKEHPLPSDYEPSDLVSLSNYDLLLNRDGLRLREVCIPDLLAMNRNAAEEGLRLVLSSAYRSYAYQEQVFRYHVETIGEEQAKRESAEPGKSQHQLGTTIDFGSITPAFGKTAEGKWLREHAWEYGFSLSYPENSESLTGYIHEIWHYRWLGRECTALERDYFRGVQQHMLSFLHDRRKVLKNAYIGPENTAPDSRTGG